MPSRIRALTPDDAPAARELRLRALREHPEAFATSYQEELQRSPAETAQRLAPGPDRVTLGAFDDGRLVGVTVLTRPARDRTRHRASIAAMYVAPEARRQRLGRALLERALRAAREWGVTDVTLAVTMGNHAARRLYAGAGFESYGIEPRSLCVEGRFYDVELMNLSLRPDDDAEPPRPGSG